MGRRRRAKTMFEESLELNGLTYNQYLEVLTQIALSRFHWDGLPDTVSERVIEIGLFESGSMVYFTDDVMGRLCLSMLANGNFDVYGEPVLRRAYSKYNNYQKLLKRDNSVIIWNNYLRTNSVLSIRMFARRLANIDRIIDVNVNAQKTPILITGTEKQRLSLVNLYKEYDGNAPAVFGSQSLDGSSLGVLQTGAPYVGDKLQELKAKIWNEAMTYLGVSNMTVEKKERMIQDEVDKSHGGTLACRYSSLMMRKEAAEKIGEMFGDEVSVEYREDVLPKAEASALLGMEFVEDEVSGDE